MCVIQWEDTIQYAVALDVGNLMTSVERVNSEAVYKVKNIDLTDEL